MGRIKTFKRKIFDLIIEFIVGLVICFILFFGIIYLLSESGIVKSSYLGASYDIEQLNKFEDEKEIKDYLDGIKFDYAIYSLNDDFLVGYFEREKYFRLKEYEENKEIYVGEINYKYLITPYFKIIIRVPLNPEFTNFKLRDLVSFNELSYFIILFEIIVLTLLMIVIFFRRMDKEFKLLVEVVQSKNRVDNMSKVKEFYDAIVEINNMRDYLKDLLKKEKEQRKDLNFQIAALSHDIKTPLTIIKGNSELLEMTQLNDLQNDYLKSILKASTTIEDYIDIMVSHTKLIYSFNEMIRVNIDEFLESLLYQIKGYGDKNIKLLIEKDSTLGSIFCSPDNLKRSLINILANAYDYASSVIKIKIYTENKYVCFSIWNDGDGFNDDALEKVGTPFFMESKKRDVGKHYGLGLYFATDVAKYHKGMLLAKNINNGAEIVLKIAKNI